MLNIGIGRALEKLLPGTIDTINSLYQKRMRDLPVSKPEQPVAEVVEVIDPNSDAAVLARAESILQEAITLGRDGKFTIVPSLFPISATDNCNLACIMCPGHSGMTGPALTFSQAENIFASLGSNSANFGKPLFLDVTAGEATLNRELHLIFGAFKERYPEATISIITNATMPVRGRVKEIFEHATLIAISIDGATKESYERVRRGSRFENVVRNATDIATLKGGKVMVIFVAMDQNIHEMAAMVRLCAEIGAEQLFIQGVEQGPAPFLKEGDSMAFDMPQHLIEQYLKEASEEAERLGVIFSPTPGVAERGRPTAEVGEEVQDALAVRKARFDGIRMCHVPWTSAPRMSHIDGLLAPSTACCHMTGNVGLGNFASPEFEKTPVNDLYNGERYWDIRQGLLDGSISRDSCKGCQYTSTYQWSASQLRELEAGVKDARSAS